MKDLRDPRQPPRLGGALATPPTSPARRLRAPHRRGRRRLPRRDSPTSRRDQDRTARQRPLPSTTVPVESGCASRCTRTCWSRVTRRRRDRGRAARPLRALPSWCATCSRSRRRGSRPSGPHRRHRPAGPACFGPVRAGLRESQQRRLLRSTPARSSRRRWARSSRPAPTTARVCTRRRGGRRGPRLITAVLLECIAAGHAVASAAAGRLRMTDASAGNQAPVRTTGTTARSDGSSRRLAAALVRGSHGGRVPLGGCGFQSGSRPRPSSTARSSSGRRAHDRTSSSCALRLHQNVVRHRPHRAPLLESAVASSGGFKPNPTYAQATTAIPMRPRSTKDFVATKSLVDWVASGIAVITCA